MKNFRKYLPSKKITAYFIIPFLAIVTFFVIKEVKIPHKKTQAEIEQNVANILDEDLKKDTDGDGVMDWEERLYKTDINLKDTDGDGLEDGVEVAAGMDPTDPLNLEYEKRKELEEVRRKIQAKRNERIQNTTQKVADAILRETIQLKKANLTFNKSANEQAAEIVLNESKLSLNKKKYNKEDLNISKSIGKEEFKKNFKILDQEIKDLSASFKLKSEIVLVTAYVQSKDKYYLKELKKNLEFQKELLEKIVKFEVPEEFSDDWLNYINVVNTIREITKIFSNADTDPMGAISAVAIYGKILEEFQNRIEKIDMYFN